MTTFYYLVHQSASAPDRRRGSGRRNSPRPIWRKVVRLYGLRIVGSNRAYKQVKHAFGLVAVFRSGATGAMRRTIWQLVWLRPSRSVWYHGQSWCCEHSRKKASGGVLKPSGVSAIRRSPPIGAGTGKKKNQRGTRKCDSRCPWPVPRCGRYAGGWSRGSCCGATGNGWSPLPPPPPLQLLLTWLETGACHPTLQFSLTLVNKTTGKTVLITSS